MVLETGLGLAAIALLPEREIQVVAQRAHPVLGFVMGGRFWGLHQASFARGQKVAHI